MTETAWTGDRVAERKRNAYLKEKLSTPEGAAQDCLERSLPPDVLKAAKESLTWDARPEIAAQSAIYFAALEQARAKLVKRRSWLKMFDRYIKEQAGTPLQAWSGEMTRRAASEHVRAQTGWLDIAGRAEELFLGFITDSQQYMFKISAVNGAGTPVFSAGMREVIKCLPECTPELWNMVRQKAIPAPLTAEEKYRLNTRSLHALDREMQERADMVNAIFTLCGSFQNPDTEATREQELTALCAVGRAFHCSACTGRSLPAELQPGFRLFKRLIALRKELIRIASAAADWEWIASQNPDVPADELTKIVTEAYREGRWPRGKLNVDYGTWHDLLNDGQMAVYPDVRPDTLYILSAQNNSLGLWRVL